MALKDCPKRSLRGVRSSETVPKGCAEGGFSLASWYSSPTFCHIKRPARLLCTFQIIIFRHFSRRGMAFQCRAHPHGCAREGYCLNRSFIPLFTLPHTPGTFQHWVDCRKVDTRENIQMHHAYAIFYYCEGFLPDFVMRKCDLEEQLQVLAEDLCAPICHKLHYRVHYRSSSAWVKHALGRGGLVSVDALISNVAGSRTGPEILRTVRAAQWHERLHQARSAAVAALGLPSSLNPSSSPRWQGLGRCTCLDDYIIIVISCRMQGNGKGWILCRASASRRQNSTGKHFH